eukprot:760660-Hanusia_phi.AAC.1
MTGVDEHQKDSNSIGISQKANDRANKTRSNVASHMLKTDLVGQPIPVHPDHHILRRQSFSHLCRGDGR